MVRNCQKRPGPAQGCSFGTLIVASSCPKAGQDQLKGTEAVSNRFSGCPSFFSMSIIKKFQEHSELAGAHMDDRAPGKWHRVPGGRTGRPANNRTLDFIFICVLGLVEMPGAQDG